MEFILFSIVNSFIIFFACTNTLPRRFSLLKTTVLLMYLLVMMLLFSSYGQKTGFLVIGVFFILIYCFSEQNTIYVVCSLLGYLGNVTLNNVVLFITKEVLGVGVSELQSKYSLLFSVIYLCLIFCFSKGLGWILRHKIHAEQITLSKSVMRLLLLGLLFSAFVYILNFTFAEARHYDPQIIETNVLLFMIFFIMNLLLMLALFNIMQNEKEMESKLQQFENLEKYTGEMESFYKAFRSAKHGYKNTLLAMDGYLRAGDIRGLKGFVEKELEHTDDKELDFRGVSFVDLKKIESPAVRGVLYNKLLRAYTKGIKTELFIDSEIKFHTLDEFELSTILGVYLDNAIEATEQTACPSMHISMTGSDAISVKIGNTWNMKDLNIHNLSKFEFSTKGKGRGVGLYEVSKILARYPHIYHETSFENHCFIQTLENL